MKVIDLLNKIAKGEEVPEKIKWSIDEWQYNNGASKNYFNDYEDLFSVIDGSNLNDEVEIIEDKPKHIEELDIVPLSVEYAGLSSTERSVRSNVNEIHKKVDELSKAVNYLLDKEGK